jgi:glutamyl/glutaminyl-tRNA synthetase
MEGDDPSSMSGLRTRIAPTPSGYLHAGNALNFLITHQLAQEASGTVTLRIDDLDADRTRPEYVHDIFDSLRWLGITWDLGPRDAEDLAARWRQTRRIGTALHLLAMLKESCHLYACVCSRSQAVHCACARADHPFDASETAWRLRIPDRCLIQVPGLFHDRREVDLSEHMRDPVLRQRNGLPSYQLMSLADDWDMRMTLIVRGEDLLPSSACQLYLSRLLGLTSYRDVRFVHHPLLLDVTGRKLSKSEGAGSLRAMRADGSGPERLHEQAAQVLARFRTSRA